jgi:hypothetical protein
MDGKLLVSVGRLLEPMRAQQQLLDNASVGEADVVVARYGIPDTNVPVGLASKAVIDDGTFDHLIQGYSARAERSPIPFFLDHGWAHLHPPYVESQLKIGKAGALRSEAGVGFIGGMQWNLKKDVAKDAFADALFDPFGTRFSFRWSVDQTMRGPDGYDHTTYIEDIAEISQLSLNAAQMDTYVIPESIKMRTSMHSTDTVEKWDEKLEIPADLPPDLLRMGFAAMDPEGDPAVIGTYSFPHHVFEDGAIGAAVVPACRQIIDDLNKARGMNPEQRVAAYRHAAHHLADAGETPEPLSAPMPTLEEFTKMLQDQGFAQEVRDAVLRTSPGLAAAQRPTMSLGLAETRQHLQAPLADGHGVDAAMVAGWLDGQIEMEHEFAHFFFDGHTHPGARAQGPTFGELLKARMGDVVRVMLDDPEYRQSVEAGLKVEEEARKLADPGLWYQRTWQARSA